MLRNKYFAKFQCLIILWGGEIESVKILLKKKKVLHSIKLA